MKDMVRVHSPSPLPDLIAPAMRQHPEVLILHFLLLSYFRDQFSKFPVESLRVYPSNKSLYTEPARAGFVAGDQSLLTEVVTNSLLSLSGCPAEGLHCLWNK